MAARGMAGEASWAAALRAPGPRSTTVEHYPLHMCGGPESMPYRLWRFVNGRQPIDALIAAAIALNVALGDQTVSVYATRLFVGATRAAGVRAGAASRRRCRASGCSSRA